MFELVHMFVFIHRNLTQTRLHWQRSYQLPIMVLLSSWLYTGIRSVYTLTVITPCIVSGEMIWFCLAFKNLLWSTVKLVIFVILICIWTGNIFFLKTFLHALQMLKFERYVSFYFANRMKTEKEFYLLSFKRSATYLTTKRRNVSSQ